MARRSDNPTAHALEEIEHWSDRVVQSVSANPLPLLLALGAVLLAAAAWGGWTTWQASERRAATAALEEVRFSYLDAMGASPGAIEIPEPANPETARRIRTEHLERYREVAQEHAGQPAALLARLEAGRLELELGRPGDALATWGEAAEKARGRPVAAVLWDRIAQVHEQEGRFADAARAYEQAAAAPANPLRYRMLGHAARAWADAGEPGKAVALYQRIRTESPETELPPHVAARLRELSTATP